MEFEIAPAHASILALLDTNNPIEKHRSTCISFSRCYLWTPNFRSFLNGIGMSTLALDLLISRAHLCHAECTGANRSPVCFTSSMLHPCLNAAYLNSVSQQALEEPKIKGICIL